MRVNGGLLCSRVLFFWIDQDIFSKHLSVSKLTAGKLIGMIVMECQCIYVASGVVVGINTVCCVTSTNTPR